MIIFNNKISLIRSIFFSFRYLRWCAYNIFLRRSKRLKQLVYRMNQMIEHDIQEYPGDNAAIAEYYNSIRCMFEQERIFKK